MCSLASSNKNATCCREADELKARLQWGGADCEDVSMFVADLGHWLHSTHPERLAAYTAAACVDPWVVGTGLLRCTMLWGCPLVATFILDRLMALPSAPSGGAFSSLAHGVAPGAHGTAAEQAEDASAGIAAVEGGAAASEGAAAWLNSLPDNGLLCLALHSPEPLTMLAAVHTWAQQWGGPSFVWSTTHGDGIASPIDQVRLLACSKMTTEGRTSLRIILWCL